MGYGAPDTRSIKREVSAMKLPKPLHHLATLLARKLIEEEVELPEACASAEVMAVRMLALANKLTTTTPLIIRHPGSSRPPTLADTSNTEVRELLRRLMPMAAIICPRPLNSDMEVDAAPPLIPLSTPPHPHQGGAARGGVALPAPTSPAPPPPPALEGSRRPTRGEAARRQGDRLPGSQTGRPPPPLQSRPVGGEAGRREGGRLRGRQPGRPHPHPHSLSPPPPPPPPPPSTPALSGGSKALPTTGPPCKGGSSAAAQLPPEASKSPPFPAPPPPPQDGPGANSGVAPGLFPSFPGTPPSALQPFPLGKASQLLSQDPDTWQQPKCTSL